MSSFSLNRFFTIYIQGLKHGGKVDTKGQTSAKLFWETFLGLGRSLPLGIYFSTMAEEEKQSLLDEADKETEFGVSSQYNDPRLDYSRWIWRDWCCSIYYYFFVFGVFGYTIYLWSVDLSWTVAIDEDIDSDLASLLSGIDDYTGYYLVIFLTPLLGIAIGFCWMQVQSLYFPFNILFSLYWPRNPGNYHYFNTNCTDPAVLCQSDYHYYVGLQCGIMDCHRCIRIRI